MPYVEVGLWASAELFSARGVAKRVPGLDFEEPSTRFVRHHPSCPRSRQDRIGNALGEGLCLELLEFGRGDRALVEQSLGCGDLFRRVALPRNVLDVGLG
jgi:hypothetical protein